VGNTETTLGVFEGEQLRAHWRVSSDVERTGDEVGLLLSGLLQARGVAAGDLHGGAICSVVPSISAPLVEAFASWLAVNAILVDARSPLPIELRVDEPLTVGADRLVNTLASSRIHGCDTIVVDLGTATTYDCITAEGVFLGGVIAPGLRTSSDALVQHTSKLLATALVPPTKVIGTRTEECIRAGVVLGAADAIDGLVRRIKAEWPNGRTPRVIATGGLAGLMAPLCAEVDCVEPFLTLHGLRLAYELLSEKR
jgi:type III pantothenate kinase